MRVCRKIFALTLSCLLFSVLAYAGNVKGRVTADGKPLGGVWVSDGKVMVQTDSNGRFDFDSDKTYGMVFIETPSGFVPSSRDGLRPDFWQYMSLPPEQEEVHEFKLKTEAQDRYSVMLPADFHINNDPRKKDLAQFSALVTPLARKIVSESEGPVYTFHLGDMTQDIFWYEWGFNEAEGVRFLQDQKWPTLFTNVMGNHDHDGAVGGVDDVDWQAGWLFRDCFGPDRWSWNIGGDHWIFLDNIIYKNEVRENMIKGPKIYGSQNYEHGFRPEQLEWLQNDLSHVDKDARVFICMHCPLLRYDFKTGESKAVIPQAAELFQQLASAYKHGFTIFSGHIHAYDFCEMAEFPDIHQYSFGAVSGDQWKSPIEMLKAEGDGAPAGMMVLDCAVGKEPQMRHMALTGDSYPYRVYDLNIVGKAYSESEGFKALKKMFPTRNDYSAPEYRNCVLVNYWFYHSGDKVELLEGGKPLPMVSGRIEDPVVTFQKDVSRVFDAQTYPNPNEGYCVKFHNLKPTPSVYHGFLFRSRTATGKLVLRITDKDGTVKYEEEIIRPIEFNPSLVK